MARQKNTHKRNNSSSEQASRWKRFRRWTGFGEKTGFDWLSLLVAALIPLAIAYGTLRFNAQQQDIQNQRAEDEQELALQRTQGEALQAYLDQMSHLMLEKNLSDSPEGSTTRLLAHARTQAVLESLDPHRKVTVIQFLYQSKLTVSEHPVVSLGLTNLKNTSFTAGGVGYTVHLPNANFDGADLTGSQLRNATLDHTYMRAAGLQEAQLQNASLEGADLTEARLGSTTGVSAIGQPLKDVEAADLSGAHLTHATLTNAYLQGIDMSPLQWNIPSDIPASVSRLTHEGRTDLSDADLSYTFMFNADLRHTILDGADFTCATLTNANLRGATGITKKQLAKQVRDLAGATMPDGSKVVYQSPPIRACPDIPPS